MSVTDSEAPEPLVGIVSIRSTGVQQCGQGFWGSLLLRALIGPLCHSFISANTKMRGARIHLTIVGASRTTGNSLLKPVADNRKWSDYSSDLTQKQA